jgi:CHASE3 domain sensor protein
MQTVAMARIDSRNGGASLDRKRAIRNLVLIVLVGALVIILVEVGIVFLGVH